MLLTMPVRNKKDYFIIVNLNPSGEFISMFCLQRLGIQLEIVMLVRRLSALELFQ